MKRTGSQMMVIQEREIKRQLWGGSRSRAERGLDRSLAQPAALLPCTIVIFSTCIFCICMFVGLQIVFGIFVFCTYGVNARTRWCHCILTLRGHYLPILYFYFLNMHSCILCFESVYFVFLTSCHQVALPCHVLMLLWYYLPILHMWPVAAFCKTKPGSHLHLSHWVSEVSQQPFEMHHIVNGKRHVMPNVHWTSWVAGRCRQRIKQGQLWTNVA